MVDTAPSGSFTQTAGEPRIPTPLVPLIASPQETTIPSVPDPLRFYWHNTDLISHEFRRRPVLTVLQASRYYDTTRPSRILTPFMPDQGGSSRILLTMDELESWRRGRRLDRLGDIEVMVDLPAMHQFGSYSMSVLYHPGEARSMLENRQILLWRLVYGVHAISPTTGDSVRQLWQYCPAWPPFIGHGDTGVTRGLWHGAAIGDTGLPYNNNNSRIPVVRVPGESADDLVTRRKWAMAIMAGSPQTSTWHLQLANEFLTGSCYQR